MWALSFIGLLCSGFNALFFLHYRSTRRRRQVGARVLAVLSLGLLLESLYFLVWTSSAALAMPSGPNDLLAVRLPASLGSSLITILILRQLLARYGL